MSNAATQDNDPRARSDARARKERIVKARRGYLEVQPRERKVGGREGKE